MRVAELKDTLSFVIMNMVNNFSHPADGEQDWISGHIKILTNFLSLFSVCSNLMLHYA